MEASMQVSPTFEVRNLRFAVEDRKVPKYWQGGPKGVSLFLDNLSTLFPAGEWFFMRSVRHYQDKVRDPQLLADIRAFHGQEAMHTREHRRYNEHLVSHGLPADELEARVREGLEFLEKHLPKRWQLAATVALEHYTALLAGILLDDPSLFESAHPELAELWRWHAVEESEHKHVAYDVYELVGGNYLERSAVMIVASVIFWAVVAEQQVRMMKSDGLHRSPKEWRDFFVYMFVKPAPLAKLVRPFLHYFRPGFHPNQVADSAAVQAWKATRKSALRPAL
jgi:uncharacterized protein